MFDLQKVGQGHGLQYIFVITPFDGKCQLKKLQGIVRLVPFAKSFLQGRYAGQVRPTPGICSLTFQFTSNQKCNVTFFSYSLYQVKYCCYVHNNKKVENTRIVF